MSFLLLESGSKLLASRNCIAVFSFRRLKSRTPGPSFLGVFSILLVARPLSGWGGVLGSEIVGLGLGGFDWPVGR